jgi:hypothetical protein
MEFEEKLLEIEKKIDEIRGEVSSESVIKKVDNSYLSISRIRFLLQIFAVIMTVFLAGAVGFGLFGLKNIFSIYDIEKSMAVSLEKSKKLYSESEKILANAESDILEISTRMGKREDLIFKELETYKISINKDFADLLNSTTEKFNNVEIDLDKKSKKINEKIIETKESVLNGHKELKKDIEHFKSSYAKELESLKSLADSSNNILEEHQKRISEVENLFKNFYEKMKTETIGYSQKGKIFIIGKDEILCKEKDKKCTIWVVMKLNQVPINETVKLRYHIYQQPHQSFVIYKNLIFLRWGDAEEKLKDKKFDIEYVADPTQRNKKAISDVKEDGVLYVDGIKVDTAACRNLYLNILSKNIIKESNIDLGNQTQMDNN